MNNLNNYFELIIMGDQIFNFKHVSDSILNECKVSCLEIM
jgi:hypothetical protein